MGPQPRAKVQLAAQHQGRDIGRLPNYYHQFHGKFSCPFSSIQGIVNGCRRKTSRPSIYRLGLCVSSPLQVWQLRADNLMTMIALYLPQLHEEGSGSEFEGTVVTGLTVTDIIS
jgi:hypothetical protein